MDADVFGVPADVDCETTIRPVMPACAGDTATSCTAVVASTTKAAAYLLLVIARRLASTITRFIAVTKIRPSAMVGLTASNYSRRWVRSLPTQAGCFLLSARRRR